MYLSLFAQTLSPPRLNLFWEEANQNYFSNSMPFLLIHFVIIYVENLITFPLKYKTLHINNIIRWNLLQFLKFHRNNKSLPHEMKNQFCITLKEYNFSRIPKTYRKYNYISNKKPIYFYNWTSWICWIHWLKCFR